MKRLMTFCSRMSAIIALLLSQTMVMAQSRLKGDDNGDGRISIADFSLVVEIINDRAQDLFGAADLNNDGKVDEQDLNALNAQVLTPVCSSAIAQINGQEVEVEWVRLTEGGPKWAVVNVGATEPYQPGATVDWNSNDVWGPNRRKPTLDELFALANLETEYITYQGTDKPVVRVIGESGRDLYLPMPRMNGTQYWSANEEKEFVLENGTYKRIFWGCYFECYVDSDDVCFAYDTDPKATKKFVRMVVNE